MQIYCRYLLQNFFKVFILAITSFIAILLVSRLTDISEFSTLGTPLPKLLLFALYQIPYVLPIAIPIAALLSAFLFFQRLARDSELIALSAGGFSIYKVCAPLIITSLFLALVTFYITSEVATTAHLKTRKMVYDLTSINPLLLLQNAKIAKLKGAYTQMDPIAYGHKVQNLLVALPGQSMILCVAKTVEMHEGALLGSDVSVLTSSEGNLAIENLEKNRSAAPQLAKLIRTKGWKISHDHLNWRLLQARKRHLLGNKSYKAHKSLLKIKTEIMRRYALAFTTVSFTLMGIAFGIRKKVLIVAALASTTLICFFIGKELDHLFWISLLCYALPHLIIISLSWLALKGDLK